MSGNPRICIFTETYYPVVGGGETQARLLAEGLIRNGWGVTIITRRSQPDLLPLERFEGVTVYRLPPVGTQHLKKWGLLLSAIPALYRTRNQYELILVSGFRVIGVSAVILCRILNKACLLKADNNGEMSGEFFYGGLLKSGLRTDSLVFNFFLGLRNRILRQADGFIAISSQIAREYSSNGILQASRIYCIPNSVDTRTFTPVSESVKKNLRMKLGIPGNGILVVYSGRLVSYKGLEILLRAWSKLVRNRHNATLLLIGSGSADIYNCEKELRGCVKEWGLEESVNFCGEVRNVHEYLQAGDIFVFPTEKEAFGISLVEAMACGLPVISTLVGGLKDIISPGQNALVLNPGDEDSLLKALNTLCDDRELREALGMNALETARSRYSSDMVTHQYIRVFKNALESKSPIVSKN